METGGKRPREGEDVDTPMAGAETKKTRHGFRVGPQNLPDGPWRRKLARVKKELIHQAKVKKKYAKIKARAQRDGELAPHCKDTASAAAGGQVGETEAEEEEGKSHGGPQLHPDRQAMLDDADEEEEAAAATEAGRVTKGRQRQQEQAGEAGGAIAADDDDDRRQQQRRETRGGRKKRPDYFHKDLAAGQRRKAEAAEKAEQARRREEERARKTAERERTRRAMAKARRPGPNGVAGQRKLGRESGVLLDRVKKLVGNGAGAGAAR